MKECKVIVAVVAFTLIIFSLLGIAYAKPLRGEYEPTWRWAAKKKRPVWVRPHYANRKFYPGHWIGGKPDKKDLVFRKKIFGY